MLTTQHHYHKQAAQLGLLASDDLTSAAHGIASMLGNSQPPVFTARVERTKRPFKFSVIVKDCLAALSGLLI